MSQPNPASEWVAIDVPHLGIIPDDLWSAAKDGQKHTRYAIATTGKLRGDEPPALPVLRPHEVRRVRLHHGLSESERPDGGWRLSAISPKYL